jgi:hypothetical protein
MTDNQLAKELHELKRRRETRIFLAPLDMTAQVRPFGTARSPTSSSS